MVTGNCQKLETLSDGSLKLSIYINKEQIQDAVGLVYKDLGLSPISEGQIERDEVMETIKKACLTILDAIGRVDARQ